MATGVDAPVPTLVEAFAHRYTDRERAYVQAQRERLVLGSPATVKATLEALAAQYSADELLVLTITGDYESRLESYRLLAQAFGLRERRAATGRSGA
jgi:alkanesulfonate monooxygenase SsuD/methylene tetrahydromethanopterin reductase-like flavin-dependent oxidoreductase (luciferase family)